MGVVAEGCAARFAGGLARGREEVLLLRVGEGGQCACNKRHLAEGM